MPTEAQPLHAFVTGCLQRIAEDGLRRIGDTGGYINPRASGLASNPVQPTEGTAVELAPGSDLLVAQWWYLESKNDCSGDCAFNSRRPFLSKSQGEPSIEGQLGKFIESEMAGCVGDFAPFREQGFDVQVLGKPSVNATVARNTVFFVMSYPLKLTRAGVEHTVSDYIVEFNVPLRDIYYLASNLTNLESEHQYLEHAIRQLIDAFSGPERNLLPPVYDFIVDLGIGQMWAKIDVEHKLRSVLESYIPFLQVPGTRGYRVIQPPIGARVRDPENFRTLYNRGFLIPLEKTYPDLDVKYSYLNWWNPYFDLNCRGQLCQPESVLGTFGFIFGFQRYAFSYDISAPVLVEIADPDAFNNRGYSFKLFLEANMRTSDPMPVNYQLRQQVEPFSGTLICNPEQWTSDNVTVTVLNASRNTPVENAVIQYRCGHEACTIGVTGKDGILVSPLPRCLGGMLGAESPEGMHPAFAPLDTYVAGPQQRTLVLEPIRKLHVKVKKYQLKKAPLGWVLDTLNPVSQKLDEQTFITLTRKGGPFDQEFTTFAVVNGNPAVDDYDTDVPFIPGKYTMEIISTKDATPPIRILPHQKCSRQLTKKKCFDIPPEPIEFNATNPLPTGFATLDWDITGAELDSSDEITFYTIYAALDLIPEADRRLSDLDILGKTSDYAAEAAAAFRPVVGQP